MLDNFVGHRYRSPIPSGDESARTEVEELVGALQVTGGSETDCSDGPGTLRVCLVWLLMSLHIRSKWDLAVLSVIELCPRHNPTWADVLGHSSLRRKSVDPHRREINQFDEHQRGDELEWEGVTYSPHSFLDHPNLSLDLRDMFVCGSYVELDAQGCQVVSQRGKLAVHE